MAVDVNWPSEDEDFDAVIDEKPGRRANTPAARKPAQAVVEKPRRVTAVAVSSQDDEPAPKDHNIEEDDLTEEELAAISADDEADYREDDQDSYIEEAASEPAPAKQEEEPELQLDEEQRPEPAQQPEEPQVAPVAAAAPVKVKKQKPPKAPKQPRQGGGSLGRTLFELILVLAIVGLGLYTYKLSSDKNDLSDQIVKLNNNPQQAIQQQTQNLITRVGQLISLPKDETPTVANISDATKAREQSAFFNNAQNGDKVLMYVKAGQAILYRPSTDKIILVAPLTFNDNPATSTAPATTNSTTNKAVTGTTTNGTTTTNNR